MAISIARASHVRPWLFSAILFGVLTTGCSGGGSDSSIDQPGTGNPPPGSGTTVPGGTATDTYILLEWMPSPDPIDGYIIQYGRTAETADEQLVQLPVSALENQKAPSYSLNAGRDLGLNHGDDICFRLRSYVDAQRSEASVAECAYEI